MKRLLTNLLVLTLSSTTALTLSNTILSTEVNSENTDQTVQSNTKFNNQLNNSLGSSTTFPPNYDGIYVPEWGMGDFYYWYMSTNTVHSVDQIMRGAKEYIVPQITQILHLLDGKVDSKIIDIIAGIFGNLTKSWIESDPLKKDDGYGIYIGFSIIGTAFMDSGPQSAYWSETDSFEVSYAFLAHDYITVTTDLEGANAILKYVHHKVDHDLFKRFLKGLTPLDHTGLFGKIGDSDYEDFIKALDTSDLYINKKFREDSKLKDFIMSNKLSQVHIQTRRSTPDFYKIWATE